MKEKKRRSTETYKEYTCEVCGKTSTWMESIERCELQHRCKHENQVYEWKETEDGWPIYIIGIRLYCKECLKEIGSYELEDLEGNQVLMGQIFNLIDEYNKSLDTDGQKDDHRLA